MKVVYALVIAVLLNGCLGSKDESAQQPAQPSVDQAVPTPADPAAAPEGTEGGTQNQ